MVTEQKIAYFNLKESEKIDKMNDRERDNYFYNQFVKDCKELNITIDEKEIKKIFDLKIKDL